MARLAPARRRAAAPLPPRTTTTTTATRTRRRRRRRRAPTSRRRASARRPRAASGARPTSAASPRWRRCGLQLRRVQRSRELLRVRVLRPKRVLGRGANKDVCWHGAPFGIWGDRCVLRATGWPPHRRLKSACECHCGFAICVAVVCDDVRPVRAPSGRSRRHRKCDHDYVGVW